jgi:hypothetical protein
MEEPKPMDISPSKERSFKGKKLIFSPPVVVEIVKIRIPFTKSTSKQHIPMRYGVAEVSAQQKGKY